MKPEGRNPKAERNPKIEARTEGSSTTQASLPVNSDFGFRPSFGLRPSAFGFPSQPSAFGFRAWSAFTLIELLIVIAIIAILAAMVIPIAGAVNRNKIKAKARGELEQVATAIELYKSKLGHYPPDNPGNPATNQLYFELLGTTLTNVNGVLTYITLDGSAQVAQSSVPNWFVPGRIGGFVNSTQGSGGEEGRVATAFLRGLKPGQITNINTNGAQVNLLVSSIPAPGNRLNPIYYVSSSPTNNPNSYDLWVDIVISGRTNRISNWSTQPITLP